jgi:hypothetical protein
VKVGGGSNWVSTVFSCAVGELRNYEYGSWEDSYVLRMVNEWKWHRIMSDDRFRQ